MVDAADLKSASRKGSGGSNPFLGTTAAIPKPPLRQSYTGLRSANKTLVVILSPPAADEESMAHGILRT